MEEGKWRGVVVVLVVESMFWYLATRDGGGTLNQLGGYHIHLITKL